MRLVESSSAQKVIKIIAPMIVQVFIHSGVNTQELNANLSVMASGK